MQLTNGEIFSAREPLLTLMQQKFPVLISYGLAKLAKKLNEQLVIIEDVRHGLIKKYGTTNEIGQIVVQEDSKDFSKFVEEFNELMALATEIVVEKVKLPETLEIEPAVLMALEKFVEV